MGRVNTTEIKGVDLVKRILLDSGIISREQGIDCGIDLIIEGLENENPTGNSVAVQVKAGNSHVNETRENFTYYMSVVHKEYWLRHSLPVILVYVNASFSDAYWQYVSLPNLTETSTRWKLEIPKQNTLRKFSSDDIRSLLLRESSTGRFGENLTLNKDHYIEHLQFLAEITQDCSQIISRYKLRLGKEIKSLKSVEKNQLLIGIRIANIDTALRLFSRGIHSSTQDISYVCARAITAMNSIIPAFKERNQDFDQKSFEASISTFSKELLSVGEALQEMSIGIKDLEENEELGLRKTCSESCTWSSNEFLIASKLLKSMVT